LLLVEVCQNVAVPGMTRLKDAGGTNFSEVMEKAGLTKASLFLFLHSWPPVCYNARVVV